MPFPIDLPKDQLLRLASAAADVFFGKLPNDKWPLIEDGYDVLGYGLKTLRDSGQEVTIGTLAATPVTLSDGDCTKRFADAAANPQAIDWMSFLPILLKLMDLLKR
jgi:hypothetical protein